MTTTTDDLSGPRLSRRGVLTGLLAGAAVATLPTSRALAVADGVAAVLLDRINAERTARGLAPLPEDPRLSVVSQSWSTRMAGGVGLAHNPRYESEYGWPVASAGEVVAYARNPALTAPELAAEIVGNWMRSGGHRAAILDGRWTDVGIGWAQDGAGRLYATANFVATDLPAAAQEALGLSRELVGGGTAPRVVITRADLPADALAASALIDGATPLLLARPGQPLAGRLVEEVARAAAPGATVHLVGGALHHAVEDQVRALGTAPVRLAGPSRYDTAAAVAREVGRVRGAPHRVHLVRADAWADAVAVAGQAAYHGSPVLLVDRDAVPGPTARALDALGHVDRLVIGGTGAVSDATAAAMGARRLSGDDRAETGANVMRHMWERTHATGGEHLVLTPGWTQDGWATALAHTTYAARHAAPLLFVDAGVPAPVREVLSQTGYSAGTAPALRFARHVPDAARAEVRALTGR